MTDNVRVREPEVARDDSGDDRSNRQPVPTDGRAEPAAPATPDKVTTADMAAAGAVAPSDAPAPQRDDAAAPQRGDDAAAPQRDDAAAPQRGDDAAAPPVERETPNRRAPEPDAPADGGATGPLFDGDQASTYRSRWQEIQTGFVDEPRAAVQEADALVAEVMRQLARTFADERRGLEGQWTEGEEISTEDLRIALRRYRSFFDRLLAV